MIHFEKNDKGYIALIAVLVASALTLAISIGMSIVAVSGTEAVGAFEGSYQARSIAASCADTAISKLKQDADYEGGEDISIGEYACHVYLISGTGNTDREISVETSVGGFVRKLSVKIAEVNPVTEVTLWKEVRDF